MTGSWQTIVLFFALALAPVGAQVANVDGLDTPELPIETPSIEDPTGDGAVDVETGATAAGHHARFAFDPPLRADDGHEEWRFRDDTGRAIDAVRVHVTWVDADGEPMRYPTGDRPAARLTLIGPHDERVVFDAPDLSDPTTAVYAIRAEHVVRGAGADWILRAEAPNDRTDLAVGSVGVASHYRSDGTDTHAAANAAEGTATATRVWVYDGDGDGWPDDADNCPRVANAGQANLDGDLHGDACDADLDDDGASNDAEAEAGSDPRDRRSTPDDIDADGYDNDVEEASDSDPRDPDSTPLDPDADGWENSQEETAGSDPRDADSTPLDIDADGWENEADNCPSQANPTQADADGDGMGDPCDPTQGDGPLGDQDADGIINRDDVCPWVDDPSQEDLDGDGRGDACDSDTDGDGYPDVGDDLPHHPGEWRDTDGDGTGDNADLDDDADGLPDALEASLGTDPLLADSDGDQIDDLVESHSGSDPLDPLSPDYRPGSVSLEPHADGSVTVRWEGTADPRVDQYVVWRRSIPERIAIVPAGQASYQVTDPDYPGGNHLYTVQSILAGDAAEFDPLATRSAAVFEQEVGAWAGLDFSDEGPVLTDGPSEASAKQSEKAIPAPGALAGLVLLAVVVWRRR